MAGKRKGREGGSIVIKKEEVVEGGHHGGAWKVAYADFVTAMMAFFLLMWLLNATTEEQRRGLADFFAPSNVLGRSTTGTGLPFGGRTVNSAGSMASDSGAIRVERGAAPLRLDADEEEAEGPVVATPDAPTSEERAPRALSGHGGPVQAAPGVGAGGGQSAGAQFSGNQATGQRQAGQREAGQQQPGAGQDGQRQPGQAADGTRNPGQAERPEDASQLAEAALRAELARRERAAFDQAAEDIRNIVRDDPALADLARQLRVEITPDGLRIQILDADRQAMFPLSSAVPNERARALLAKVAQVVTRLPNPIAIAGHTDATPFRGGERTNWDLSADRANAVRRLLNEQGIPMQRIRAVSGMAEREPLLPEEPTSAGNRRVAITLLRQASPPAP